jgi:hypothetical protein
MELNKKQREAGEASNPPDEKDFWKDIWQLKIPNSTKTFLWRACSDILPSKAKLAKRGVVDKDTCELCGKEAETAVHVLWSCPAAQDVWGTCCLKIQKMQSWYEDFMLVFADVRRRCNEEEIELFAVIAKAIWARRNGMIHGEEFIHPNTMVNRAVNSWNQFKLT